MIGQDRPNLNVEIDIKENRFFQFYQPVSILNNKIIACAYLNSISSADLGPGVVGDAEDVVLVGAGVPIVGEDAIS